jgi:catechol 2,3-dioxygenase-like lactoylglutathione lyase family enzyme
MFDHIGFRVRDLEASRKFYLMALGPLGVGLAMEGPYGVGLGRGGKPSLWLSQGEPPVSPLHIAFTAKNRA